MYRIFLTVLFTLIALPAFAAEDDWIFGCNENATNDLLTAPVVTALAPGERACSESITSTNVTEILDVSRCDHIDVFQFDDPDGDADVSTVTGQPEICPNADDDDDSCDDFGLTAFTADTYLEGLGASRFRVASAGVTDTAQVRWEVRCVGPTAGR